MNRLPSKNIEADDARNLSVVVSSGHPRAQCDGNLGDFRVSHVASQRHIRQKSRPPLHKGDFRGVLGLPDLPRGSHDQRCCLRFIVVVRPNWDETTIAANCAAIVATNYQRPANFGIPKPDGMKGRNVSGQ